MNSDNTTNKTKIWGWAAVAGVLAFFALKLMASYSTFPALLLAILIAVLVAILLWIGFFRNPADDHTYSLATQPKAATSSPAASTTVTEKPAAKPAASSSAALKGDAGDALVSEKKAETAKPAAAKTAAKPTAKTAAKPAAKPKAVTAKAAPPKAAPKKAAATKTAAPKAATPKAATTKVAKASATTKAAPKTVARKPVTTGGKPEMLTAARTGGPDDLKQIKGVGPKLEAELNKMGVYHFDQVAGWRKQEVTWMDENLAGVRQRVSRDGWVAQAKVLAKGGTTEFSKRVKEGDVY